MSKKVQELMWSLNVLKQDLEAMNEIKSNQEQTINKQNDQLIKLTELEKKIDDLSKELTVERAKNEEAEEIIKNNIVENFDVEKDFVKFLKGYDFNKNEVDKVNQILKKIK